MHERIMILQEVLKNIKPFETKEQITHEIHSMLEEAVEKLEQQERDIEKTCNYCKFSKETNVCYDNGDFFIPYLYCSKIDDLVADNDSCDEWESYINIKGDGQQ